MEQLDKKLSGLALTGICLAVLWFALGHLLRWLWPLVCAWLLSGLIRRPVAYLSSRRILKKQTAALLLTLVCLALGAALVWLAISLVIYLLGQLSELLPSLLQRLQAGAEQLLTLLRQFKQTLPEALGRAPLFTAEGLTAWLTPERLGIGRLLQRLTAAAVDLPGLAFCLVFLLTATYYLTVDREAICEFLHHQLSGSQSMALNRLGGFLKKSVLGWLRAQAILISVTFALMLISFWLMGLPYPLLTAALVGAVDALPVLGAGAVLLPWAIWSAVTGSTTRGGLLLVLYAVNLSLRNLLEPRLVSSSLGLHPFVTLLCLFFGFRLAGIGGMFALPLTVLALNQLQSWGYIRLWK